MDEELQLFYEDTSDQLQRMESALLDAADGTADQETIGEIFRAMHTIKGTAGMFDFDQVVRFTHTAENLLDEVRNGKIAFDSGLGTLYMQVKDHTEAMVEHLVQNEPIPSALQEAGEKLRQSMQEYMGGQAPPGAGETATPEADPERSEGHLWHVSVRFDREFFHSGMDVLSILRFFNKQGTITRITPVTDSLPPLSEMDPRQLYIGFEIEYDSLQSKQEIEEIFEFVEDDVELAVFAHDDKERLRELLGRHEDLETLLVENGHYGAEELSPAKEASKERDEGSKAAAKTSRKGGKERKKSFSLRVDSLKIDGLLNKMSEMVIKNAQIAEYASSRENESLEEMSSEMSSLLEEVRDGVMNIRMVQVKDSFIKYRRIVNDTASKMGKEIDFIIEGEDTELDKSVIEKLSDPLTHMIRNAIDHGVESPQKREELGKPRKGKVWLRAYPDAGSIIIELEDDGAGIDRDAVEKKAIDNGILERDHTLGDREIYKLIFAAGLSTAKEVSDLSGRGVGMDVVKRNIDDLRGTIDVDSARGKGSKITVRLPLTLAIIDGFLVQAGQAKYIIPLEMIVECLEYNEEIQSGVDSENTISVRGEILPLLNIKRFFHDRDQEIASNGEEVRENIVVVRYGTQAVGLLVDELFGEQQTVIKSLGAVFEQVPGISGGSILGNGEVALIFDIPKLIEYKMEQRLSYA